MSECYYFPIRKNVLYYYLYFQGGQFILNLVDFFGGGFMIFALTVLEVVGIIYVYGFKRVLEDIKFMLGIELGIYWKFCWGFLVPVSLSFFFIYYSVTFEKITYAGNSYPDAVICKYKKF